MWLRLSTSCMVVSGGLLSSAVEDAISGIVATVYGDCSSPDCDPVLETLTSGPFPSSSSPEDTSEALFTALTFLAERDLTPATDAWFAKVTPIFLFFFQCRYFPPSHLLCHLHSLLPPLPPPPTQAKHLPKKLDHNSEQRCLNKSLLISKLIIFARSEHEHEYRAF